MRIEHDAGGYAYLLGLTFAGNGVIALPGMTIERAVLHRPRPLPGGFEVVREHLERMQRPLEALCGIELRSPRSQPLADFIAFNHGYNAQLGAWGLLRGERAPLARTNVAPVANPPASPALTAFSYTVTAPGQGAAPEGAQAFVLSGAAEVHDDASYPEGIVRPGDTGQDALVEKARVVVKVVDARLRALGASWDDASSVHLYSAHPVAFVLQRELLAEIGVAPMHGITWHDAAPPVHDLALEIDVRRYHRELTLPAA